MAGRRGIWLVITFIVIAVMVSAAGLIVAAFVVGTGPQVSSNSALVLRVSGDLREVEPGGLVGSLFEPPPTVRTVVEALRKAKVDRRVTSVVIRPTGTAALWGTPPRNWYRTRLAPAAVEPARNRRLVTRIAVPLSRPGAPGVLLNSPPEPSLGLRSG